MIPEKLNTQTGHPLAPGATLTPTETPYEAPTPGVTLDQLKDVVNSMSYSNYKNLKANSPGLLNIAPNKISGYGQSPMDFYNRYDNPAEAWANDPKGENYDTVYWNIEDNDFSGELGGPSMKEWADNNIGNLEEDYAAKIFNMMMAANDYDRYQNAQQAGKKYRDEDLYGSVLAEMLEQAQQKPVSLDKRRFDITPRQRNITGSYDWEEAGAFIPWDSPSYGKVGR